MDRDPVEPTFQFISFFSSSLRHPAPGTRIESSMFLPLFIIVNRLSVVCGCGGWLVFFIAHTHKSAQTCSSLGSKGVNKPPPQVLSI